MNIAPQGDSSHTETASESPAAVTPRYAPLDRVERHKTLCRILDSVERLQYLEVTSSSAEGEPRQMIAVQMQIRRAKFSPEMIKADLRTVWQTGVAEGASAVYRISDTYCGFEFRFALMYDSGQFVTGLIEVDLTERPEGKFQGSFGRA